MCYETTLIDRKVIAEDTMALSFERPEGYEFRAGQYCFLSLPDN
jgi:ferredoxin-NADP reductase